MRIALFLAFIFSALVAAVVFWAGFGLWYAWKWYGIGLGVGIALGLRTIDRSIRNVQL